MPSFCAAYGCSNNSHKEDCRRRLVSFHAFPLNNSKLLQQWLFNMKRANFIPKTSSRLCSDHFEEDCFMFQNFTNRREVKKNAVPTKFNFKATTNMRAKKMYDDRKTDEVSSTANSDQSDDAAVSSSTRKRRKVTKSNTAEDRPKVVIITCRPASDAEEKHSEYDNDAKDNQASSTVSLEPDSPHSAEHSLESNFCEEQRNEVLYEDCETVVERRHREKMQRWDRLIGLMEELKNI